RGRLVAVAAHIARARAIVVQFVRVSVVGVVPVEPDNGAVPPAHAQVVRPIGRVCRGRGALYIGVARAPLVDDEQAVAVGGAIADVGVGKARRARSVTLDVAALAARGGNTLKHLAGLGVVDVDIELAVARRRHTTHDRRLLGSRVALRGGGAFR